MANDWFRNTDWSDGAREEFERRLRRARPDRRAQYLRVQAVTLKGAGSADAAAELLSRITRDYGASFEYPHAVELLGDIAREQGDVKAAEQSYRRVLEVRPDLNTTSGMVRVSLAELLLDRGTDESLAEAQHMLEASLLDLPPFNSTRFRFWLASARLAKAVGAEAEQREAASAALALVDAAPSFSRHPTVGLVEADESTLQCLREMLEPSGR